MFTARLIPARIIAGQVKRRLIHQYAVLPTSIDTASPEFQQRKSDMDQLENELKQTLIKIQQGGGERAREKLKKSGKMTARER